MQEAKTLPNDCARCMGTQWKPCDTCRRMLWAMPDGERSIWIAPPMEKEGDCPMYWPVEKTS